MSAEKKHDPLLVEALAFETSDYTPDSWRDLVSEDRAAARAAARELLATLESHGVTVRVGRRARLEEFCLDLRTHPPRPAYDAAEELEVLAEADN